MTIDMDNLDRENWNDAMKEINELKKTNQRNSVKLRYENRAIIKEIDRLKRLAQEVTHG